jgi:hypothetical protein
MAVERGYRGSWRLIAVRQLQALRELQGPREKKLRLSDLKAMFSQMKDQA